MAKHYKKNQDISISAEIFKVIFHIIWFLVSLPFKKLRKSNIRRGIDKAYVGQKWQEIEVMLKTNQPLSSSQAVIAADKLLDHLLKQAGFQGQTMGDRLRAMDGHFREEIINEAWSAHKVRNQIAHEMDHRIDYFEAQKVLAKFKKVIFSI